MRGNVLMQQIAGGISRSRCNVNQGSGGPSKTFWSNSSSSFYKEITQYHRTKLVFVHSPEQQCCNSAQLCDFGEHASCLQANGGASCNATESHLLYCVGQHFRNNGKACQYQSRSRRELCGTYSESVSPIHCKYCSFA